MKEWVLPVSVIVTMALSTPTIAGTNLSYKAAMHVVAHQERTCEGGWPIIMDCTEINTTHTGCSDFDVFPVFFDLVEVQRLEYAISWPAEWGDCAFIACAGDNITGGIASPGDGIAHEWTQCHRAETIIPGYARFVEPVSPGIVALAVNPATAFLGATDCEGRRDFAIGMTASGVCGIPGEDPCDCGCAAEYQTWSAIKSMFR